MKTNRIVYIAAFVRASSGELVVSIDRTNSEGNFCRGKNYLRPIADSEVANIYLRDITTGNRRKFNLRPFEAGFGLVAERRRE